MRKPKSSTIKFPNDSGHLTYNVFKNGTELYIQDVWVDKPYRGKNLAKVYILKLLHSLPDVKIISLVTATGAYRYWRNQGFNYPKGEGKWWLTCSREDYQSKKVMAHTREERFTIAAMIAGGHIEQRLDEDSTFVVLNEERTEIRNKTVDELLVSNIIAEYDRTDEYVRYR